MASTSETGHLKNITNFGRLTNLAIGFGAAYAPSNAQITIAAMADARTKAEQKHLAAKTLEIPYKSARGIRRDAFAPLPKLSTRLIAALDACGAPQHEVENARSIGRKISGKRAPGAEKQSVEGKDESKTISVSQRSFDRQADFFEELILVLESQHIYAPNEPELQTASLRSYHQQLTAANAAADAAYAPYSNALIDRNAALYGVEDGLTARASSVKKYVLSIFGADSPQYSQVRGIPFRTVLS